MFCIEAWILNLLVSESITCSSKLFSMYLYFTTSIVCTMFCELDFLKNIFG